MDEQDRALGGHWMQLPEINEHPEIQDVTTESDAVQDWANELVHALQRMEGLTIEYPEEQVVDTVNLRIVDKYNIVNFDI